MKIRKEKPPYLPKAAAVAKEGVFLKCRKARATKRPYKKRR